MMSLNRLVAMSFLFRRQASPLPLLLPAPGNLIDLFFDEMRMIPHVGMQARSRLLSPEPPNRADRSSLAKTGLAPIVEEVISPFA